MTFIFIFLPIVCTLHVFIKKEWQNLLLLIASFIFYAWGEPAYLAIMLITIVLNYVGAIALDRWEKHRKKILFYVILGNLGFLFYFKYFNFVLAILSDISSYQFDFIDVVMPIGISFYTFQAISYVVDVYRRQVVVQKNIYDLALYISLFPQLIAGPIVKYHDVFSQIQYREVNFSKIDYGVKRFIIGLAKKVLIANTMGQVADQIFSLPLQDATALILWIGVICYSFQLYYDFSGYSDMAIGLGSIFGFRFLENFNYPYISKSITEFWRRWHISLSTWFKEYVYIPLGGNRVAPWRIYLNLFLVFFCTGIWHGASLNFVVWGLWHGAFIVFERISHWHSVKQNIFTSFLKHIYTIFVILVGWVFFRATDMETAMSYLQGMFGFGVDGVEQSVLLYLGSKEIFFLGVAVICSMPIFRKIIGFNTSGKIYLVFINCWLMFLFVFAATSVAASTYNPFIYFRF